MIEILSSGILNTVQDLGRPGWLASGVSLGGAMDRPAMETANRLLGNLPGAAGLEVQIFPFRLRAHKTSFVAVTGADCEVTIDGLPRPPWWAAPLGAGQTLALGPPRSGARAYIGFAGGIDVPVALGSRSTDVRGRFGGLEGRGLSRGDRLALGAAAPPGRLAPAGLGAVPADRLFGTEAPITLRVLPAAEHDAFAPEARQVFFDAAWTVTAEANRMGFRLSGPALTLQNPRELLSHGIMPGTVQVPPAGQPIVQLADANTCGGYPKIATVIEADLWRLAQAPPGSMLRFIAIEENAAADALRAQARWMNELTTAWTSFAGA